MIQGIAAGDFAALTELKAHAATDAKGTAPEVARQFEAIFLQSMLKSMRMGEHFLDESSPFRGRDRETFQDMLDAQYASNIAASKGLGLAEMLSRQLESAVSQNQEVPVMPPNHVETPLQSVAYSQPVAETVTQSVPNVDDFVKSIWPQAKAAASLIGLDPKILMAQAALETGWGKFIIQDAEGNSSHNLFNIKSAARDTYDSVAAKTTEYSANMSVKVDASFKKYASVEDSFSDYVSLIKRNARYQGALASTANPEHYVNELSKAGYATDPKYSTKILAIYHGDELNQALQRCGIMEQV